MRRIDLFSLLASLPEEYPGVENLTPPITYLMGCRNFDQFCCTVRALIYPTRYCPFCRTEMQRRGREAEDQTERWMLVKNEFPHKNTRQMLLIVPIRHVGSPSELDEQDWVELGALFRACGKKFGIEGGGVMWRFGDPKYNVGTVEHLHINIIQPVPGKEYRPPLAKNAEELAEDFLRMRGLYDELVRQGGKDWLFSPGGIQVTQPKI